MREKPLEVREKIDTKSFRIGYAAGTVLGVTYVLFKKGRGALSQKISR